MFYAYVQRFDVMENFERISELNNKLRSNFFETHILWDALLETDKL